MKTPLDIAAPVTTVQRPKDRSRWLALGGWRTDGLLPGEHLLDALRENA